MLKYILSVVASVFVCVSLMSTSALSADRVYESGSVWNISFVQTKPGKYNDYLADLKNVWRVYLEAQMKDGHVLSYKILNVAASRKNESNLVLMVEFKNWASFDRDDEYFEKMAAKIQGSVEKSTQANVDRESLRILNGSVLLQEVKFK
ncbi:MAG: hypothetical protein KAI89_07170 [Emcibacter sp.]|nr:hypothetical protein [Emcibacter sp.]